MSTLTWERVKLLQAVYELSSKNEFGVVSIRDLIETLGRSRSAVAKQLISLKKAGLVENPLRGYYRLTSVGEEVLNDFVKSTRRGS